MSRPPSCLSRSSSRASNTAGSAQKRVDAYKKVFRKFDVNDDNEIELTEVCEALGIDAKTAQQSINFSDVDADGKISFNEFYLLVRLEQKKIENFRQDEDDRWKSAFNSYDKDNSGLINCEEFHKFWKAVDKKLTSGAIDLLFAATDIDSSGEISYEEFCAVLNFVSQEG